MLVPGRPRGPRRARRRRRRARHGGTRPGGSRRRPCVPRGAPRARPAPARRARDAPVRERQPTRLLAGVPGRARRDRDRGRARAAGSWTATRPPRRSWWRSGAPPRARLAEVELPAPLAEPRLDFRVDLASALSYEVRAGEYIQVIDVQGRQCSDFLAFNHGKLAEGPRARPRRRDHPHADGQRLPEPRAPGQVLRRGHGPARGGRARHGGPPRHVRARVHVQVLRGHGLPRAHQLHRELQRRRSRPTGSPSARAGRRSTSSTTRASTATTCCSWTSPGRGRGTTCCCGR